MIINNERFVIAKRRKTPEETVQFLADDRYAFYDPTELTSDINDAYKYINESLAHDMIGIYGLNKEDFEVRQVNVTYEVV